MERERIAIDVECAEMEGDGDAKAARFNSMAPHGLLGPLDDRVEAFEPGVTPRSVAFSTPSRWAFSIRATRTRFIGSKRQRIAQEPL